MVMKQQKKLEMEKIIAEKRLNGEYVDEDDEMFRRGPLTVAVDGFIDYQVDFTRALSEKDDNSWAEGVSEDSETYEMWEEYQDPDE